MARSNSAFVTLDYLAIICVVVFPVIVALTWKSQSVILHIGKIAGSLVLGFALYVLLAIIIERIDRYRYPQAEQPARKSPD